jgi:hypothetical protein
MKSARQELGFFCEQYGFSPLIGPFSKGPFGITISISAILKKCDFKTQFIKKAIFKIALSVW